MMQVIICVQFDDSCFCVLLFLMYYCLCCCHSSDGASAVVAGRLFHSRAVLRKNECACASTREWGMWYLWFAWYCICLGVR